MLIVLWCVVSGIPGARAQSAMDSVFVLPDTSMAFTLENFYVLIQKHHPVVKQVGMLRDFARQEIRLARGNFDPKLEVSWLKKEFKDTEYYNIFNSELKFPSYFPIDPKIGMERNTGKYLNPERSLPADNDYQQFYAGVSLPLARGLLTDDRRTALKQAELFQDMTEAEQVKLVNKLLLEAAKDYWQWFYAYYNYRLYNRNVVIAEEIYRRVKVNCDQGEAAPIDSVLAKITLQQRIVERQEAFLDFQNSGIQISNYLWDSLASPLALPLQWVPVKAGQILLSQGMLDELAASAKANHPELRKIRVKLQQLDLDRRLAQEYIKPQLNVSYYFLNQPFDPEWNARFNVGDDYKIGLDFSFPLFIRKERAKLASVRLKVANTQYDQRLTERQIVNEIQATYNRLINNQGIIQQQGAMVGNYNRILQAEVLNVEHGESDLFKLNIQMEKLIYSQSKLLKLLADFEKQKSTLYWAAGIRNLAYTP